MKNKKITLLKEYIVAFGCDSPAHEYGTYMDGMCDALELLETGKITSKY